MTLGFIGWWCITFSELIYTIYIVVLSSFLLADFNVDSFTVKLLV